MLKIEDLSISYGNIRVLNKVCLYVGQGEIVVILGANGSGKTTLLRAISGLIPPVSGRMSFFEKDISLSLPGDLVRLGICHVPEGRHIFPTLSVYNNLGMGAYLWSKRKPHREFQQAIDHIFQLFPILKERRRQKGSTLSGGEQQLLAIARALMSRPKLLMLDEPSMGLAPLIVKHVFETIRQLNDQGMTVLLVEQNVRSSLSISTRGYVLKTGQIVLEGSAQELLANEEVKAIYLGERTIRTLTNKTEEIRLPG